MTKRLKPGGGVSMQIEHSESVVSEPFVEGEGEICGGVGIAGSRRVEETTPNSNSLASSGFKAASLVSLASRCRMASISSSVLKSPLTNLLLKLSSLSLWSSRS